MNILDQLKRDEGLRLKPYVDTVGKMTIGYGRNLSDVGISDAEAVSLLSNDVQSVTTKLITALPWTGALRVNENIRWNVLVSMAFNMGIAGLLTFKNTLQAVQDARWDDAAELMLVSKWAAQVGQRAIRLAQQMRTGLWQ